MIEELLNEISNEYPELPSELLNLFHQPDNGI